jgi:hypothetical protein
MELAKMTTDAKFLSLVLTLENVFYHFLLLMDLHA